MKFLIASFENLFDFKLEKPLKQSSEIEQQDFRIRYVWTKDASEETVLYFLVFEREGFSPIHKQCNRLEKIPTR